MAKKVDLGSLKARKAAGEKHTMLTAYDFPFARLLDEAGIDSVLVGDSLGNVVLGYPDTRPVTMDEMLHHTRAVGRAVTSALLIGDMPFMSYNVTLEEALRNGGRFLKEAGADLVKLEGGGQVAGIVAAMVRAGIPVCGHLGLTPQTASQLGGYRVQGRTAEAAMRILEDALRLEDAGASILVLECVPDRVASRIAERLAIPVVGIGAGPGCDGQVLVLHDMLGLTASGPCPKFVRVFAELGQAAREALAAYRDAVRAGTFPGPAESFTIADDELEELLRLERAGAPMGQPREVGR
ncbi:MAG: 3-methyl-2-oxobutanoate hydroxymethyltransferase [Polyangia bacterium]|jgi:3-methyl-2-oxobutanoate hydroxymethyltransferase|nr:3-methyl-2-oxobutanoate hydroxymethyltransferase [Polyangia bacterium]